MTAATQPLLPLPPLTDEEILSIGYEGRSPESLLALLQSSGVTLLLDIRELPLSRRKGFSKSALKTRLERAGIGYRHVKEAGNPYRRLRARLNQCLGLYRHYLSNRPEVVGEVAGLASGNRVAFLCYERRHDHCHRSVLLEEVRRLKSDLRIVQA